MVLKKCVPVTDIVIYFRNVHREGVEKAKHCSKCNKCIERFDHHCRWLNNCVGGANYKWFALTIASGLVACLAVLAFAIHVTIMYWTDKNHGNYLVAYDEGVIPVCGHRQSSCKTICMWLLCTCPIHHWNCNVAIRHVYFCSDYVLIRSS